MFIECLLYRHAKSALDKPILCSIDGTATHSGLDLEANELTVNQINNGAFGCKDVNDVAVCFCQLASAGVVQ